MSTWKQTVVTGAGIGWGISLLISSPAQARNMQSLPALEQQLELFLGKQKGEAGGARQPIDRRLRLKKCPQLPVIEKRNQNLALIRCEPLNWRISVPLVRQGDGGQRPSQSRNMVRRGQPVLLVVQKNGFMISRQMQADRGGGFGDIIPVRSARRSSPILAEIIGEGRVALPSH